MISKLFLVTLLTASSQASKLKVVHPSDLVAKFVGVSNDKMDQGLIRSSLSNFGHFDYGTTIKGRVHYPIKNQDGCLPFEDDHFNKEHLKHGEDNNHPKIIMVDRGNCHFVQKAKNIEWYGGVMGVIVDNMRYEDPDFLVMADDGTGQSVNIPTFLISYYDGDKIKKAILEEAEEDKLDMLDGDQKTHKNNSIVIL
jgi:hypothetical protein